jgi:hypothetical protein
MGRSRITQGQAPEKAAREIVFIASPARLKRHNRRQSLFDILKSMEIDELILDRSIIL